MTDRRTTIIGAVHRRLFALRLAFRSRGWPVADSGNGSGAPTPTRSVRLTGFFSEALGIGSAAGMTAVALEHAGLTVVREDLRPMHRHLLSRQSQAFAERSDARIWLIHANPPEALIALFARDVSAWRDLYRIGYWTWESSLAPKHWLSAARWFHEIWVPAASVRDAFADAFAAASMPDAGRKLRVMPHPVMPLPEVARGADALRAITLFDPRSDIDRKNPAAVIAAWIAAFPSPGPDRLIVKSLPHVDASLEALKTLAAGRTDIEFRCVCLSRAETEALIAGCDILISLHRGEGFGLTLAEAMSAGVAVVATGWSGNMAFMTPENSIPVPYRLVAANRRHNGPEAQWAEPDTDAAAQAIRDLASNPALRQRLGRRAQSDSLNFAKAWTQQASSILFRS